MAPERPHETTTVRGRRGEALALAHLEAQGLTLIERNYRCRGGEIDLVMMDRGSLVLVEVRRRSRSDYGGAAATVDGRKQGRVVHAAKHLLMMRAELRRLPARFDVVAIDGVEGGAGDAALSKIEWIKDAFRVRA